MSASVRVGYRAKPNDEKILLMLAEYLDRDISDTLRFAVTYTAREYGLLPPKKKPSEVVKVNERNKLLNR